MAGCTCTRRARHFASFPAGAHEHLPGGEEREDEVGEFAQDDSPRDLVVLMAAVRRALGIGVVLENENREKTRYRWLWQTVTGIAASVIIILGGFLFYQQQQKPFKDTFDDPREAYAYAKHTLQFISGKYNKGLAGLSGFEKLQKATQPIKKGIAPVNKFYNAIEKMEKIQGSTIPQNEDKKTKSTDSI
jgi:hypothetical protein